MNRVIVPLPVPVLTRGYSMGSSPPGVVRKTSIAAADVRGPYRTKHSLNRPDFILRLLPHLSRTKKRRQIHDPCLQVTDTTICAGRVSSDELRAVCEIVDEL